MKNFEDLLGKKISKLTPVSGGDIGSSFKAVTDSGIYYIKKYSGDFASKEADGLREMSKARGVNLPEVVTNSNSVLILKYIKEGRPNNSFNSTLAKMLSLLHSIKADYYGYNSNNYIGSTPQINSFESSWADFYVKHRLDYQVKLASKRGFKDVETIYFNKRDNIIELLEGDVDRPTLIHGDLWSGNVISNESGDPVLIDPAVYYGTREMELVMMKLFGGFSNNLFKEYEKLQPLNRGWQSREGIYTLYHILNHLNLFGSGYKRQAITLLERSG